MPVVLSFYVATFLVGLVLTGIAAAQVWPW